MDTSQAPSPTPSQAAPLSPIERRILGVLMEKARTTPDSYPLTLNSLLSGCNQKTARVPVMQLTEEQIQDALDEMKRKGIATEVHGAGRVPKYRHLGYDYLNVRGAEAAVMTELLLRGEQTLGDLRSRASRLEQIPDLGALQEIIARLKEKELIVELTPPGRGQVITHNLYPPEELEQVRARVANRAAAPTPSVGQASAPMADIEKMHHELQALREEVKQLSQRVERLETRQT